MLFYCVPWRGPSERYRAAPFSFACDRRRYAPRREHGRIRRQLAGSLCKWSGTLQVLHDTVHAHLRHLYAKLHVGSRVGVILLIFSEYIADTGQPTLLPYAAEHSSDKAHAAA